jgi:hypothetical protein
MLSAIEQIISNTVSMFMLEISEKYPEIPVEDLETMWNNLTSQNKAPSQEKKKVKKTAKKIKEVEENQEEKDIQEDKTQEDKLEKVTVCETCIYTFSKGDKKDQQCGSKTKNSSYCTKHKRYETEIKTVKPLVEKPVEIKPEKAVNIVLVKHKTLEKLYHPASQLVFKSNKERIVIGKCVDNILVDLTDEDIEECKRWRFNYEEKKVNDVECVSADSVEE